MDADQRRGRDNLPSGRERRRGVSVRLFLADGTPDGLRSVEKSNWTGVATTCSRAQYPDPLVRAREEFGRPGVYVLVGPSASGGTRQAVYVGQADVARDRLDAHLRSKDFWTHLVLFSSKDANLNKAHVQYLEARLLELARRAKRADLENETLPSRPYLSEADTADAEFFLEDMLLIYPLLGVTAFEVVEEAPDRGSRLILRGKDTQAYGRETPEGFVVFAGSVGRCDAVPSIHAYLLDLRRQLIEARVLDVRAENVVLTQDYRFDSPSTAAGVLLGRSANGREEWKDETGRTLKKLQEAQLSTQPPIGVG